MNPRRDRRRWLLAGAVLVGAIAGAWLAFGMGAAPPPAAMGADPMVSPAVERDAGSPAVAAVTTAPDAANGERIARVGAGANIRGHLRDAVSQPMAGFVVQLWPHDRSAWPPPPGSSGTWQEGSPQAEREKARLRGMSPAQSTNTDARGAFAFVDLPPGSYDVRCAIRPETAATGHLEPAASLEVVLQLPPDVAIVTGTLFGEGADEPGNDVAFYRDNRELFRRPPKDGEVRCVLAAGRYELRAGAEWVRKHELWFSRHELVVPPGVARVSWRHEFGGTPCEVIVRAPPGGDRSGIGVDVNSKESADRSRDPAYTAKAGRVGKPVRLLLPPGTWRIHVHGDELTAMPEREVVVQRDSPLLRVEFDAEPAAAVSLALRDGRGASISIAPELMPPVVAAGRECPCLQAKEGTRTPKLRFPHVPLGAGELRLEDRLLDGVHTFLPFEPLPPVALLVQAGQPNALELAVQRRPLVDLRACDASGREDGNACIAVFLGERRVRGRDEVFAQRFAAWLPPGDYRVVVDRNGALREHPLAVARTDVTVRYRP
ncbi:MAG: carboxypeptidase-like regulatory domain-containing protein [Planctomycetota bacterium]